VRGDAEGASFVGAGDEPEEQLGAGVVEGGEADLVDEDEVGAQDLFDDAADAVVGDAAVGGLNELGGGEGAGPVPGVDGRVAEGDEEVALAGPGRADEAEVLPAGDPLERREVVEGRRLDRRRGDVEVLGRRTARADRWIRANKRFAGSRSPTHGPPLAMAAARLWADSPVRRPLDQRFISMSTRQCSLLPICRLR
jgi:hypothetical protein